MENIFRAFIMRTLSTIIDSFATSSTTMQMEKFTSFLASLSALMAMAVVLLLSGDIAALPPPHFSGAASTSTTSSPMDLDEHESPLVDMTANPDQTSVFRELSYDAWENILSRLELADGRNLRQTSRQLRTESDSWGSVVYSKANYPVQSYLLCRERGDVACEAYWMSVPTLSERQRLSIFYGILDAEVDGSDELDHDTLDLAYSRLATYESKAAAIAHRLFKELVRLRNLHTNDDQRIRTDVRVAVERAQAALDPLSRSQGQTNNAVVHINEALDTTIPALMLWLMSVPASSAPAVALEGISQNLCQTLQLSSTQAMNSTAVISPMADEEERTTLFAQQIQVVNFNFYLGMLDHLHDTSVTLNFLMHYLLYSDRNPEHLDFARVLYEAGYFPTPADQIIILQHLFTHLRHRRFQAYWMECLKLVLENRGMYEGVLVDAMDLTRSVGVVLYLLDRISFVPRRQMELLQKAVHQYFKGTDKERILNAVYAKLPIERQVE